MQDTQHTHHEQETELYDDTGVHASHCCKEHGCKYFDDDCPVVIGKISQWYDCEDCCSEKERFAEDAQILLESPKTLSDYLTQLQEHTKNPLILHALAQACEVLSKE
jgi:hypothetical protein